MRNASVLLVEDDSFARTTLSQVITNFGYHVKSFSQASMAIECAREHKFQLALLDIDLGPGPSGIDISFILRRLQPQIGLMFLTSYSDPRFVGTGKNDLPQGSRYLIKSKLTEISALENVIEQTIQYPLRTSRKIPKSEVALTRTQFETLKLVAEGKSTEQIAQELGVTEKSVEAIISRIHSNLNIADANQNKRVRLTNFYYKLIGKI